MDSMSIQPPDKSATMAQKMGTLKHLAKSDNPKRMQQIREAAKDFEAMFVSQMLEHMFAGVKVNPMGQDGAAEDMYQSMLLDEYGKIIAQSGGVGIADHVMREMTKMQDIAK